MGGRSRRGAGVPRADHRRVLRHRPGDQDRPRDGHRVRHERPARRGQLRPGAGRPVPRPLDGQPARLLARGRARDRRGGAQAHRGRAHRGVGDPQHLPRRPRRPRLRAAGEGDAAPARTWSGSSTGSRSGRGSPRSTTSAAARRRTSRRSRRPAELAKERGEPWPPVTEPPSPRPVGSGTPVPANGTSRRGSPTPDGRTRRGPQQSCPPGRHVRPPQKSGAQPQPVRARTTTERRPDGARPPRPSGQTWPHARAAEQPSGRCRDARTDGAPTEQRRPTARPHDRAEDGTAADQGRAASTTPAPRRRCASC